MTLRPEDSGFTYYLKSGEFLRLEYYADCFAAIFCVVFLKSIGETVSKTALTFVKDKLDFVAATKI